MKIITQIRTYNDNATIGEIFVDNQHVCYTLEDIGRAHGVKIPGETCIPEGCYVARVTMSNRFKREMIELSSAGKSAIIRDDVTFTGVRVHKGNSVEDTEGCVLVGTRTNYDDRIWDCTAPYNTLTNLVKTRGKCLWVITSK